MKASKPSSAPTAIQALPSVVAWLGYGGLLPFVALAAATLLAPEQRMLCSQALIAYGAVILGFVGALHWGIAMVAPQMPAAQRVSHYLWSVVPALLAWPTTLLPVAVGALVLIGGFAAHLVQDLRMVRSTPMPRWYLPLRLQLTGTACICLGIGAWAAGR
ncbi:MAG: DUF3429 domain-containing protein [Burkholderiaceae bacterium]|nr:DUF3429 domain-containing protein [Burkholderiaceae bacterium]